MAPSRASYVLLLCASSINGKTIVSTRSGKCLDADDDSPFHDGTHLQIWKCNGGGDSQEWTFSGDRIVHTASGMCIDADADQPFFDGTHLQLWNCKGGGDKRTEAQTWKVDGDRILHMASGKCVDARMETFPDDGTRLQLWKCDGADGQHWNAGGAPHKHHPAPHKHHPAAHSHHPHHPEPQCAAWPRFASENALAASPWGAYFEALYGSMPPANQFPLDVGSWWILWDDLLTAHGVPLPKSSGKCAPANCQLSLYRENNAYSPAKTQWIWHPPPYHPSDYAPPGHADPWTGWVEIMHKRDPFGDEHYGEWFTFAKGSAVWYHTGKSIEFDEHSDAYAHFGQHDNEAMSRAAAAAGYDTVIFLAHHDHVNYPCDTAGKYPYMNVELVAVKLKGTYSCGVSGKPDPGVLRSGWGTDPCSCDNALEESNCGRLIRSLSPEAASSFEARRNGLLESTSASTGPTSASILVGSDAAIDAIGFDAMASSTYRAGDGRSGQQIVETQLGMKPPGDCTRNHSAAADPPWFATCKTEGACLRIAINSSMLHTLNIGNTTRGTAFDLGFHWCIDHLNQVVYAKMNGTQPSQAPYYAALFEIDDPKRPGRSPPQVASCRFLATHWASGNLVHVFQEDMLNCSSAYVPSQLPGPDGVTNAVVYVT